MAAEMFRECRMSLLCAATNERRATVLQFEHPLFVVRCSLFVARCSPHSRLVPHCPPIDIPRVRCTYPLTGFRIDHDAVRHALPTAHLDGVAHLRE